MLKFGSSLRTLAAASAIFLASGPALAGDEEQALKAIAQAQGKIDAAAKLQAGQFDPAILARAQTSLRLAQEKLKSGKEQDAITNAVEAQGFADTAIGESQASVKADAQIQASTAASAQQDAASANARADAAERAAASASADAQAARAAAATVPASTSVTTETVKGASATTVHKATVHKAAPVKRSATPATVVEKTTTTVTNR